MQRATLGLVGATALVVGNVVGSGTYLLPAALAPYGLASLYGWAASFAGAIALALTFVRLARAQPAAGGPYAYARAGFGPATGFLVAWCYWVSIVSGNAAIAVAFASNFGGLVPAAVATPLSAALTAVTSLWLCTAVNACGLRATAGVQNATTALKLVPLVVVVLGGAWALAVGTALDPTTLPDPLALDLTPVPGAGRDVADAATSSGLATAFAVTLTTASITLWAFLGLESATVPAERVRDASRTVPRATLIGTLIAGGVTLAACSAVMLLVPSATLATAAAPFGEAAARLFGEPARPWFAAAAAISCYGALNGWVLMQAEVPHAAARDASFPAVFARVDARGTPIAALVIGSALATVLIAANYGGTLVELFTAAVLTSTAATLVPYVICAAAAWRAAVGWRAALIPAAALLFSAWALVGTGAAPLAWCAGLAVAGLAVYATFFRARRE